MAALWGGWLRESPPGIERGPGRYAKYVGRPRRVWHVIGGKKRMEKFTLQAQAVLYNNEKEALGRSLESMARAVELAQGSEGWISGADLWYGDSSPAPLFCPDAVSAIEKKYRPYFQFHYTFFNGNFGSAKGQNTLAAFSRSGYLLLMNPDILLAPDALLELHRPFEQPGQKVGLAEARQVPIEHPKDYDRVTGETEWSAGACFLVPAALFRKLGGFDADTFFMYCDDVDFSWRLRLSGYRLIYQPSAMAYHAKRLSDGGSRVVTEAELYYSAEASLLMAYKWSEPALLEELLRRYQSGSDPEKRKAVEAFQRRREEGRLPVPVDPEHKVAKFVGDYYTRHRFSL